MSVTLPVELVVLYTTLPPLFFTSMKYELTLLPVQLRVDVSESLALLGEAESPVHSLVTVPIVIVAIS